MIEYLSQLSKTIPLTSPPHTHNHSPQLYNILTHNHPSQLTLLSSAQQFISQSHLIFNEKCSQENGEGGIFRGFTFGLILQENGHHQYHQLKKQHNNNHKKDHQPGLKIQQTITAQNYGKYIKQYINGKFVEFVHTNLNNNIQFDKIVLKLFMMLRYDNCFHVDLNKNKLYIKWEQQQSKGNNSNNMEQKHESHQKQVFQQKYNNNYLQIQLVQTSDYDYRTNNKSLNKKQIQYIKTQQYLTRVQKQLSFINNNKEIIKDENKNLNPVNADTNPQINQKLQFLTKQNKILKEQLKQLRQQIKQQGAQILKNSQYVNNILRQIQGIQKYIYTHGQKLEIQQNKVMKVFDDIQEIKKQIGINNSNKLGNKSTLEVRGHQAVEHKDNKHAPYFVPDHLREKLSIDLHSNYLSKFQISGSQITYIGQDKQATQLLSSRVYGITQKHKHLKNTLKILKTRSKCIKFGIIDHKYSKQRSCWNSTNIIYLHGWGHTMASTSEQDHKNCDYGTGNIVEMQANFQEGWIKWAIDHSSNNSRGVKLSGEKQKKLLRNGEIQWVPFVAMYDYLDAVQWKIGQQ